MPILFTDRFVRAYDRLPDGIRQKVKKALRLLDTDARHPSLRVHPIRGHQGIYEARVDQKYRMSFEFDGDDKIMRNVDNHNECLKSP
jgi:mRNA-degrading endonuclease RelE of RelBE toxin-antitoxin system